MSNYQSIKIKEAMNNIATNTYLLPAIQRKFVWEIEQIEMLFDSILREYPINSFMLWRIQDLQIKQNYKFYKFIEHFVQKFGDDNPDIPAQLITNDFYAVIDGQQRLTSLYIGLIGTYKVKKPNKRWMENEQRTSMSEKKLYIEITTKLSNYVDNEKMYNFKFLDDEELQTYKSNNPNQHWFKVGDILKYNGLENVNKYLIENNLLDNDFAMSTLTKLFDKFNKDEIINYYCVDEQDQNKVLEIFIRTNSGGTSLSFSDLLMSISSANWEKFDAREQIKDIRQRIYSYGHPNFNVSQDFILKALLVLTDNDVRFKIQNFSKDIINSFEIYWKDIKKSLEATFHLLEIMNFNDTILRAKNAAIPIAYYIYKNNLANEIVKSTYDIDDKNNISKWLSMTLLKGIFGGTSDNILKDIRDVIKKSKNKKFPLEEIVEKFKSSPDKNYNFDEDIIKPYLEEQWGSGTCGIILNLLYPEVVRKNGISVAQDHMHPKSQFENGKLSNLGLTPVQEKFFKDKLNYNSCLNLQLLESLQNESKSDKSLEEWAVKNNKNNSDLYLSEGTSLDIMDFEDFINDRRKNMMKKIKEILNC